MSRQWQLLALWLIRLVLYSISQPTFSITSPPPPSYWPDLDAAMYTCIDSHFLGTYVMCI